MICKKCVSENMDVQAVTEHKLVNKKHGIAWWILVGWYWLPIKWLIFTLPALIVKVFKPKKQKMQSKTYLKAICQNCGFSWNV